MSKTDQLIADLITAKIITDDKLCDKVKAKNIILNHFHNIHNEAVFSTIIACNKINFQQPKFSNEQ